MTTERIVPRAFQRTADAVAAQTTTKTERVSPLLAKPAGAAETARNENNNPNRCPVCNRQYLLTNANGHNVLACLDHAIVMPVKD